MDRLPPVAATAAAIAGALWAAAAAAGCKDDGAAPARRERVNAVKASDRDRPTASDVCDRLHPPGQGPVFAWPALAGAPPEATSASGAGQWRWINVWATWCKPCVTELPRLVRWQGELAERGIDVSLELLSADASDEDVAAFRASHPGTPASARVADVDALPAWVEPMGVSGAALPIHIFADPGGRVRCVRASAVEDADYRAVEALLRGDG